MASILVSYGTGEGQTAKIANRLGTALADRGHRVMTVDIEREGLEDPISDFDAVLVGTSIHAGSPNKRVVGFVQESLVDLAHLPTGFFLVCLSAALADEESQAQAAGYLDEFLEETDWHPDRLGLFGGALRYSEYGFIKRAIIKQIAKKTTGDTDPSRDYDYTDWAEVDRFAEEFGEFVETARTDTPIADQP